MKRAEILDAAKACVCGEREQDYGTPEDSFGLIGQLWTVYMGTLFTAKDVAMMLALLKVARIHNGDKMDSFIDLAGYAACRKGGPVMAENRNPFLNQSGCPDPTAYHALKPIMQEDAALEGKVNFLIKVLKFIIAESGFELLARIELKDKKTGRCFR